MHTKKIFITGCSRSGTTLVHRCLAAHSGLHSLPETNFFGLAISGRMAKGLARLGLVRKRSAQRAMDRLARLVDSDPCPLDGPVPLITSLPALVDCFVSTLDAVALKHGGAGWIEKTPRHFQRIDAIRTCVPEAHFIHVVRRGDDVVASIYDRAMRYPDRFGPSQRDLRYITGLWNEAARTALGFAGRRNHHVVLYEEFCLDPELALTELCRSLEIPFEPDMLSRKGTEGTVTKTEPWKAATGARIVQSASKFEAVLQVEDQKRVQELLDWQLYESLLHAYRSQMKGRERRTDVAHELLPDAS